MLFSTLQDLYGGNALVLQTPSGGKVALGGPGECSFDTREGSKPGILEMKALQVHAR